MRRVQFVEETHLNAPIISSLPQLQEKPQTGTAQASDEEKKSGDQRGRSTGENKKGQTSPPPTINGPEKGQILQSREKKTEENA
jgi:hypothetical protein